MKPSKMIPERKTLLVEALRSGKYAQGTGALRKTGYCCLGVGCDISELGDWISGPSPGTWTYLGARGDGGGIGVMPSSVAAWYGLDPVVGNIVLDPNTIPEEYRERALRFVDSRGFIYISALNDNGFTFNEIADIIEVCA